MFASATHTLPAGKHPSWHKQDGRVGRGKSNRRRGPEAPEHPQWGSGAPVSSAAWGAMHCDVSERPWAGLGRPTLALAWPSCPLLSAPPVPQRPQQPPPGVHRRQALPAQPWWVPVPHPRPAYPRRWMGGCQRAGFQGWRAVTSKPPRDELGLATAAVSAFLVPYL